MRLLAELEALRLDALSRRVHGGKSVVLWAIDARFRHLSLENGGVEDMLLVLAITAQCLSASPWITTRVLRRCGISGGWEQHSLTHLVLSLQKGGSL